MGVMLSFYQDRPTFLTLKNKTELGKDFKCITMYLIARSQLVQSENQSKGDDLDSNYEANTQEV